MPADATTGQIIVDRYELLSELGRGPVGVVWRARDLRLQREVAVREVTLPNVLDVAEQAALAEKVLREARSAAALDHPAVVSVLDVVDEDGRPYVVTELFHAPNLEEVVADQGPLSPERAAGVGMELLAALAVAHDAGLVHRDLRPSNVLLPEWGGARLADFGVASMVDDPRVAASGAVPAPSYLAPEQTGTAGASAASDLWSLGATLYFAVEGMPPFDEGEPAATLAAIREAEPRPALRSGSLQPVLDRLLVKDPLARPDIATTRELLASVEAVPPVGDGAPIGATEPAESTEDAFDPAEGNGEVVAGLSREPWFFEELAVEPVPSRRPVEPPREPAPPWPPPKQTGWRVPRGLLITVITLGVGAVMLALVLTNGRLRPSRPSLGGTDTGPVSEWVDYTDGTTGFTIRHPEGWAVRRSGTITDFVDPRKPGNYLRIDYAEPPAVDQQAAWVEQEKTLSARVRDYSRIRIEPTTFQTFDGALWEFTYSDRGVALRALDLGFSTGRYGFALNFQTHAEDWEALQPVFEAFKAAFRAPA